VNNVMLPYHPTKSEGESRREDQILTGKSPSSMGWSLPKQG